MIGTACTDDARVKVPSFQKVTFLLQYERFHRDAIHLFFVCMIMFLTAVIKDEHASDDSLQSDSSFLLRNCMMTDTTLKFSFLHAIYIGSSHCSVRLIICDTVLQFSAIMYYH